MMQREPGKYYLEIEPGAWAWALGDGIAGGDICHAAPRRELWGDPAASLTLGEMLPDGLIQASQYDNSRWPEKRAVYERLAARLGTVGLFVRAPEKRLSAAEFVAARLVTAGAVQAVSRTLAIRAARWLPLTAIFTHRRLPLFRDEYHRQGAITLAGELTFTKGVVDATWLRPGWGLGPEDDWGDDHYLRPVMRVIERLDWEWGDESRLLAEREPWRRARQFFAATPMAGQPFAAARIARVSYVATGEEDEERLAADAAAGIQIIEDVPCIPS